MKTRIKFAADIFFDLLYIWSRRLASQFSPNSLFQHIVLRIFNHYHLKLAVRYLVVRKSFGKKPINSVSFRNGKGDDLLMFLYLGVKLFAGDYQPISPWAACGRGFHRQMQRSNRRESDTRSGEAVRRQRRHEALQKIRDLRRRQDNRNLYWQLSGVFRESTQHGSENKRFGRSAEWAEKWLHNHKGAVWSVWWDCAEMRPCSQFRTRFWSPQNMAISALKSRATPLVIQTAIRLLG